MSISVAKLKIADPVQGFTERDTASKAILNTDINSLLNYKIQKRKMLEINRNRDELESVKNEISEMKNDLMEIKTMLLTITKSR